MRDLVKCWYCRWGWNIAVGSAPRADRNAESVPKQFHAIAARAGREPYQLGHSGCGDAEGAAPNPSTKQPHTPSINQSLAD